MQVDTYACRASKGVSIEYAWQVRLAFVVQVEVFVCRVQGEGEYLVQVVGNDYVDQVVVRDCGQVKR